MANGAYCFNSSVGILVVRTRMDFVFIQVTQDRCFNSSVGILVVRTSSTSGSTTNRKPGFQFLGRNSGRSDGADFIRECLQDMSFNSSVGILVVRTQKLAADHQDHALVSIPRSEFWSFGRVWGMQKSTALNLFQFLGRNSGRSDARGSRAPAQSARRFQFLGRNSGRSDNIEEETWKARSWCFNSSVGILVVRTS